MLSDFVYIYSRIMTICQHVCFSKLFLFWLTTVDTYRSFTDFQLEPSAFWFFCNFLHTLMISCVFRVCQWKHFRTSSLQLSNTTKNDPKLGKYWKTISQNILRLREWQSKSSENYVKKIKTKLFHNRIGDIDT